MKNKFKKASVIIFALAIMLMNVMTICADQPLHIPHKSSVTMYSAKTRKYAYYYSSVDDRGVLSYYLADVGKRKVTVRSSNKKVATVRVKYGAIFVAPKKVGKTTITVKNGKKTYRCVFTVHKYVNPISKLKIGKDVYSGKLYNKNAVTTVRYSKYANKNTTIKFNLKKGWKVTSLYYRSGNWIVSKPFKNGKKVKVKGKSGFYVNAEVMNTKTRQYETIVIHFK